eukprot:CAMPEP_0176473366 /NCGR_PEP_ID=MMETSP0127-20121128/42273_1 /TAXON_ID=938130 /ORGANISM="Platyophrya macrostoma, Strain WH" /LENGTH=279 /DNA_ID=CAMNT_0017868367 /DNA_START=16 /DNA_END=855 /DNA_ORIENTATION=+
MSTPQPQEEQQIITDKGDAKKAKPKGKYDFAEHLQKGAYIDVKDTVGRWCQAQIIERDDSDDTVKYNFDGWSHKWDEWAKFASARISPFRKFSRGYTGQSRCAIRYWTYSLEKVEEANKRLEGYLAQGLINSFKSCHEITQTLRGSEFIFLDALLAHEYENPAQEFPTSLKYFINYFKLYIHLLKMIPEYLSDYIDGLSNPDAFLTNERIAVIHSFYEISDSVNKILGGNRRVWVGLSLCDRKDLPVKVSKTRDYAGKDYETTFTSKKIDADDPQDNTQ